MEKPKVSRLPSAAERTVHMFDLGEPEPVPVERRRVGPIKPKWRHKEGVWYLERRKIVLAVIRTEKLPTGGVQFVVEEGGEDATKETMADAATWCESRLADRQR